MEMPLSQAKDGTPVLKNVLNKHTGPINAVALSLDNSRLITGSEDKTACLWDLNEKIIKDVQFTGHYQGVVAVALSPDGSYVATGDNGGRVGIWDLRPMMSVSKEFLLPQGGKVLALAFLPNSKLLLVGTSLNEVRIWDLSKSPTSIYRSFSARGAAPRSAEKVSCVALSPAGRQVAIGFMAGIKIWDVPSPGQPRIWHYPHSSGKTVFAALFTHDGTHVLLVKGHSEYRKVSPTNIELIESSRNTIAKTIFNGPGTPGTALAISNDDKYILTTTGNKVLLHDISKPTQITTELRSHEAPITALAFCSKGCHALTGSEDTTGCLWYLRQSPPECYILTGHTGPITVVAFFNGSCDFLTASKDGTVRLWEIAKKSSP